MTDDDNMPGDINPDPDDEGFWCPKFLMPCDAVPWGGCHRGYAQCPHSCAHEWVYTGTPYGVRGGFYCAKCGTDGEN